MAEETRPLATRGLEGVIAAETRVGYVDGINGKLYYRGFDVNELAAKASYVEVVHLLWEDELPTSKELEFLRTELIMEMNLPQPLMAWLKRIPKKTHPMVVLRSAVSDLAIYDREALEDSPRANRNKAIRLTAKIPTIIAAYHRAAQGLPLLEPDHKKGLPENFLRMFLGREVTGEEVNAIELMFILHAEHGFNASTFAARVTAGTLADMYAAVTTAIGTLMGPLHGGANQRVMQMLTEIGRPEDVDDYIDGLLARKERVMGFGHRVYKVEDPRARHLRKAAAKLCERNKECFYVNMSDLIEKKVKKAKGIYPNVDFYSASVQHSLQIPVEFYTTLFAASRVSGWTAHVLEQYSDNRLIRPRSAFVGRYPRDFTPISKRK